MFHRRFAGTLLAMAPAAAAQVDFRNLEHAAQVDPAISDTLVAYFLNESAQGGVDHNLDGDALDTVLHVYDICSDATVNSRIAGGGAMALGDDVVLFGVLEANQGGADLNGDGDAIDRVLHSFVPSTGTVRNLQVALAGTLNASGQLFVGMASEGDQSADLNGDGDTNDNVAFTYDHAAGQYTNLGLASTFTPIVAGGHVALGRSEPGEGLDLNGDGDQFDSVLHVLEVATGTLTNTSLQVTSMQINPGAISVWVFEVAQGADLNGDGDTSDRVMHVVELASMSIVNTGLAVANNSLLEGRRVAFGVRESDQGADLNGDGDTFDNVAHVFDLGLGLTLNTGLAAGQIGFSGPRLLVGVPELNQFGVDLNGDGDALDQVAHVYNVLTGATTNYGLANAFMAIDHRNVGITVLEAAQGATDLNGDGDATDAVLYVHRTGAAPVNLGLATTAFFRLEGDTLLFNVSEIDQGADRNADGDALDTVLAGYRFARPTLVNYRLATDDVQFRLTEDRAAVGVLEASQGASDLNFDGDAVDAVLWVAASLF